MKTVKKRTVVGLVLVVLFACLGIAQAQSVEEFYKGKTVILMVSAPAGTITDLLARQFKEYYQKHIPGQPDLVVMNVPGAGGMKAAAKLQLDEATDGTVIGFLQRNNLFLSLVKGDEKGFDPREVNWIGSLDRIAYCLVVSGDSPVQNAKDMFTKKMIVGATGYANENRTLPALLNEYAGAKFKIIHGYNGRGEVYLAMERKEVDGWASTIAGLNTGNTKKMVESGQLKPIVHFAWKSHPNFPDVPNLSDYIKDSDGKKVVDFLLAPFDAGRPIAVPKAVPADRLEALRKAFDETMKDQEFLDSMKKRDWPVDPISGVEVEKIRDELYSTPESTLKSVRDLLIQKK